MDELFSIGEVSKIKGITIKALRYYHEKGILIPKYIDDETGYRYYTIDQFIYIDIIVGCRNLGTSIKELQEIFEESSTDRLLEFLNNKKSEAEENISNLKLIIHNINSLNKRIKESISIVKENEIKIKEFDERRAIAIPCIEAGNLKELIYYSKLDKVIKEENISAALERGIIYDFKLDKNIRPKYVFNTIEKEDYNSSIKEIIVLPKGKYITITYNNDNALDSMKKVINYIRENNLTTKLYLEVELFNDLFNTYEYNCQIQVLVE